MCIKILDYGWTQEENSSKDQCINNEWFFKRFNFNFFCKTCKIVYVCNGYWLIK